MYPPPMLLCYHFLYRQWHSLLPHEQVICDTAIPSYLIFRIIVWKWCVRSCFLRKNGGRWPSLAAIFPQKSAPHTSLSHYNAKYQITRNSRIKWALSNHSHTWPCVIYRESRILVCDYACWGVYYLTTNQRYLFHRLRTWKMKYTY